MRKIKKKTKLKNIEAQIGEILRPQSLGQNLLVLIKNKECKIGQLHRNSIHDQGALRNFEPHVNDKICDKFSKRNGTKTYLPQFGK